MGADLIISTLWAELGLPEEREVGGKSITFRPPLLNWKAGHDHIDSLTWSAEEIEQATQWSNLYIEDDETIDADASNADLVAAVRKQLHAKLTEMQESIEGGWRDVDARIFGDAILFLSGGMSWGDMPTEAGELWSSWEDINEYLPGVAEVISKVGFWWLGDDDAPFEIVRKGR